MVYGDELSSDRVFKARESVFAPGEQLDTDSEDELYHGEESPFPDDLLARHKQGRDLPVRSCTCQNLLVTRKRCSCRLTVHSMN